MGFNDDTTLEEDEKMDSTLENSDLGRVVIIQGANSRTPLPNPEGGNITFTFEVPLDEAMYVDLWNVHGGATIYGVSDDGSVTTKTVGEGISEVQRVYVGTLNAVEIIVELQGMGAVSALQVCRDATRTLPPDRLAPPTDTNAPTSSPTATIEPTPGCPSDVPEVLAKVGEVNYPEIPIEIISQDTTTVTFRVKNTFNNPFAYVYTQYQSSNWRD